MSLLLIVALLHLWVRTVCSARTISPVFVGPQPCPSDDSVWGYDNTTTLTNDMFLMSQDVTEGRAERDEHYLFVLCPNTVFDLGVNLSDDDDQWETPIIPFFDNSTFQCGMDGRVQNRCVIRGGHYQVIFDDDFWWVNNVAFSGFTFKESQHISVLGFGHPQTDIKFSECRWEENVDGEYLVAIYWNDRIRAGFEPSSRYRRRVTELITDTTIIPGSALSRRENTFGYETERLARQPRILLGDTALYAGFERCDFLENKLAKAGILNQGGRLELSECVFMSNIAIVVVANIQEATVTVHSGTSFVQNNDKFGPVFVDSSSELKYMAQDTSGEGNIGSTQCQGVFVEKSGYDCIFSDTCKGDCCEFGLSTCDHTTRGRTAGSAGDDASWSSDRTGGKCGPSCVVIFVLIPLLLLVLFGFVICYARRRKEYMESEIDFTPDTDDRDGAIYML